MAKYNLTKFVSLVFENTQQSNDDSFMYVIVVQNGVFLVLWGKQCLFLTKISASILKGCSFAADVVTVLQLPIQN